MRQTFLHATLYTVFYLADRQESRTFATGNKKQLFATTRSDFKFDKEELPIIAASEEMRLGTRGFFQLIARKL